MDNKIVVVNDRTSGGSCDSFRDLPLDVGDSRVWSQPSVVEIVVEFDNNANI